MISQKSLDIATAKMHAETLAARFDPAVHLYLDLMQALIDGPDTAVEAARSACIEWEVRHYAWPAGA